MKYIYKIKYDLDKDIWNWLDSLNSSFMGFNWINNIDNKDDKKIAKKISSLEKEQAELILRPYLENQKNNSNKLNNFLKIFNNDFNKKYLYACQILEKITNRPMMSDKFTFYITTFPRCPYDYEKCEIFIYYSTKDFWGMPIDTFLHEGLHFQFTRYWGDDKNSPVSKLNDDEFEYIKEALTVVLDKDLVPLISQPDLGYQNQTKYRQLLHKHWQKHHNFDELINYGLSKLNLFI